MRPAPMAAPRTRLFLTAGSLLLTAVAVFLPLEAAAPAGPAAPAKPAAAAGYGYRLPDGQVSPLWWAEGAYKVMRDDPLPAAKSPGVSISAAGNEFEPFLLVLRPAASLDDVRVSVSDLAGPRGAALPAAAISIRSVEYVRVTTPTDAAAKPGWWPDPLPPVEGPFSAAGGENHPLWITVKVPAEAVPGEYKGLIRLTAGARRQTVPLTLKVRDFALPSRSSIRSSFGLPTEHIRLYHNLETREELEKVVDLYYQDMRDHRVAPTYPFELYPIEVEFDGLPWKGGEFASNNPHGGGRCLKIVDDDHAANVETSSAGTIPVETGEAYSLSLWARAAADGQDATVMLEALDSSGKPVYPCAFLRAFK
ncbi:MAG: DUF6067 family protein, partial [Acidobacteriota bacterium]|nr:DUF6067 family protein [Acidobacteriota bacterium]